VNALPMAQQEIEVSGHAIEARVYAENVNDGFAPSCGVVDQIKFSSDQVRVDYGVRSGHEVSPFFDPMIAKVISYEQDREKALKVLDTVINGAVIQGVDTNLVFLSKLLNDPCVIDGNIDNGFIDNDLDRLTLVEETDTRFYAIAGLIRLLSDRGSNESNKKDPWTRQRFTNWRLGGSKLDDAGITFATKGPYLVSIGGMEKALRFSAMDNKGQFQVLVAEELLTLTVTPPNATTSLEQIDEQRNERGERLTLSASCLITFAEELTLFIDYSVSDNKIEIQSSIGSVTANIISSLEQKSQSTLSKGTVTAPVMGQVVKVNVSVGDHVKSGDVIAIQESMKMELSMVSPCATSTPMS